VTVLTLLALAVVGFFGYQASASPDRPLAGPAPVAETPADTADTEKPDEAAAEPDEAEEEVPALPPDSGQGTRVVYSLQEQRVWLVRPGEDGSGDEIVDTYPVYRSSVDPEPGSYAVSSRTGETTGSDGVPIQHVVVFAAPGDVVFGFSTAVDGSLPDPEAEERTGGIRQPTAAGEAMWQFAAIGTAVIVVP
jgi:hypothetical protein